LSCVHERAYGAGAGAHDPIELIEAHRGVAKRGRIIWRTLDKHGAEPSIEALALQGTTQWS
jgi:hypothetical protein